MKPSTSIETDAIKSLIQMSSSTEPHPDISA